MTTQYLTCAFKLHNPSAKKRKVLDHALEQYTIGYNELLDHAKLNEDYIKENGKYKDRFNAKSIAGCLPRPRVELHSSAIDSLVQDVAANLASYFALSDEDEKTGFPVGRNPNDNADINALDNFIEVGGSQEDFDESVARLLRCSHSNVMPLYFCRADGATQTRGGAPRNRNFSLLTNKNLDKFLAVMWLLPGGHHLCQPLGATQGNLVKLDSGEMFSSNSRTAVLVPIEIGQNGWQMEKFISAAIQYTADIKTGFLIKKDDEYYIYVAFAFECPEQYKPETFLGIDRGVFFSMAYGLVDKRGGILEMGHKEDGFRDSCISAGKYVQELQRRGRRVTIRDYRSREREMIIHSLANDMIELALEHRAMIVTEDLNIRIRGKFYKSAWRKMYKILEYKCRLAGVPLWKGGIWAAYSSQICIYCGELNKDRKRDGSPFSCPNCGAEYHSDEGAGINIARRALYRKKDWNNYMDFHRSFANGGGLGAK